MKRVITIKKIIAVGAMVCKTGLMMCACTPHASTINQSVWKLADDILSINGANRVIFQTDIPYTINTPGTYVIGESLTNVGASPVITINVLGVTIDLKGYGISTVAGATSGILFASGSGGKVTNGTMRGFPSGCVNFNGALYGKVDSLLFRSGVGVAATNMSDLVVSNSNGTNITALAQITGSSRVVVRNCFVSQGGIILGATSSSNIMMHDCLLLAGGLFSFDGVTNSIVEDCLMGGIATSSTLTNGSANNILRNIKIAGAQKEYIVITGATSSNNLIEGCTFVHQAEPIALSSIRIDTGVSRTHIVSTVIKDTSLGQPDIIDNGTNTEVLNCFFSSSSVPGITFAVINNTNVVNNTANWWQNLSAYSI